MTPCQHLDALSKIPFDASDASQNNLKKWMTAVTAVTTSHKKTKKRKADTNYRAAKSKAWRRIDQPPIAMVDRQTMKPGKCGMLPPCDFCVTVASCLPPSPPSPPSPSCVLLAMTCIGEGATQLDKDMYAEITRWTPASPKPASPKSTAKFNKAAPSVEECRAWLAAAAYNGGECRHCVPRQCPMCTSSLVKGVKGPKLATLYGMYRCIKVYVYSATCPECDPECNTPVEYDGHDDGVFAYTNETLVHEEVLRDFWNTFFRSQGVTFDSHHRHLQCNYDFATSAEFMSRGMFTECLHSFLDMLDSDPAGGMDCAICRLMNHKDRTFIFDGIEEGMLQSEMQDPPKFTKLDCKPIADIPLNDYAMVPHLEPRTMLNRYCDGTMHQSEKEFDKLTKAMRDCRADCLVPLLEKANSLRKPGDPLKCPDSMKRFLKAMASPTPTGMLFMDPTYSGDRFASVKACLDSQERQLSLEHMAAMDASCPVLGHALKNLRLTAIPDFMRPTVEKMVELARKPGREVIFQREVDEDAHDAMNMCYPAFTKNYKLPPFQVDAKNDKRRAALAESDACTKLTKSCATLTHGVVVCHCPHGIILGFEILHGRESPKAVFEFLARKFPIGPRLVIYDNACALAAYCYKRMPSFFSKTDFRVDTFHYIRNHIRCSEGFGIQAWPCDTPIISKKDLERVRAKAEAEGIELPPLTEILYGTVNSQVMEQNNSRLRYIATPLAYMTHANYYKHMQQFAFRFNVCRLAKMYLRGELETMRLLHRPLHPAPHPAPHPEPRPA